MKSMFKEAMDGPYSMRRTLAFLLVIASIGLSLVSLRYAQYGWVVFIPSGLFLIASIVLLFFTTWTDITALVSAAKNITISSQGNSAISLQTPIDKQPSDLG